MSTPQTPGVGVESGLPGRVVDLVNAAVLRLGLAPFSIGVQFALCGGQVDLNIKGSVDEATGRAVFAALGATDAVLGKRYGRGPQANLEGDVPVLGTRLSIIVDDLPAIPAPEPGEVRALVCGVDAARAAAAAT
jgi:hypothetical protein